MSNAFSRIGEAVQNDTNSGSSADDSGADYEQLPYAKMVPTTVLSGTITDVFYTGSVTMNGEVVEQQDTPTTDGSWGFTVENPEVLNGTVYQNTTLDDEEITLARQGGGSPVDYRIFDQDDDGFTENYDADGNVKSVANGDTDDFHSSEVESIGADKITVFIGSLAGQFVARNLDANGGYSAYVNDDGEPTNGLIEYPPDWDNGLGSSGLYPRVARYPELRSDLEGEEVFIYLGRYNGGRKHQGFCGRMTDLEDEMSELDEGEALSADALSGALIDRVYDADAPEYDSTLAWSEQPTASDTEDSPSSESFDIGGNDGGSDDSEPSQFTDGQENFISQILGMMESGDSVDDVFPDFEHTLDNVRAKNVDQGASVPNSTDVDELRSEINDRNSGA
jgi:hypothetical protein